MPNTVETSLLCYNIVDKTYILSTSPKLTFTDNISEAKDFAWVGKSRILLRSLEIQSDKKLKWVVAKRANWEIEVGGKM
ncbi:MAG: hypothetical protein PHU53_06320 [Thermoplasmata archaeon]|nr:hypothetical protein [Thermoplasmata archaeon]